MIEEALYYHITNTSAITALVSTRIYPAGEAPQSPTYPYLTWQKIGNSHERHQGGGSSATESTFQFNCWALSAIAARNLYDVVRQALDNYRGEMGEDGSRITVQTCYLDFDFADFEMPTDGRGKPHFRELLRFVIWHEE